MRYNTKHSGGLTAAATWLFLGGKMDHNKIISAWNSEADNYNQWDNLGEDEKLLFAFEFGRLAMQQESLECCHMYAKDCGCWSEIAAEIMRCKK